MSNEIGNELGKKMEGHTFTGCCPNPFLYVIYFKLLYFIIILLILGEFKLQMNHQMLLRRLPGVIAPVLDIPQGPIRTGILNKR
jgi:hypothetical protein